MEDMIVEIPEERVKFFGTTGRMLLPSTITVATAVQQIPAQKLITTSHLRAQLSRQFNVEGTCPVTTKKALLAIANDPGLNVPYWRVVNQNGGLISQFPGGIEGQAARLRDEGFIIEASGKTAKVKYYKDNLM